MRKDTCDRVGVDKDERVKEIVAAVLLQGLGQEGSAQLKVRESLVQTKSAGQGVCQQCPLIEISCCLRPVKKNKMSECLKMSIIITPYHLMVFFRLHRSHYLNAKFI